MKAEFIKGVTFGLISSEQVRRLSVAKLTIPDTYDEDGYPIDGGLLDQRLGVVDPGLVCKTCGARAKVCPGHFGHIDLVRPVIHPEFAKFIYMLLQSTCQSCHRIMLSNDDIEKVREKANIEELTDEENAAMIKKLKSTKKCPHCGAVQGKIKLESPTYFYLNGERLKPDIIKDMLSKISDEDLKLLGINPELTRPEWAILDALLVPPVNVRPSITLESGERSEDDLTHKLVDIMRINQRLEQNINAGAPQIIIDDLWELLQYNVTTYFDNEMAGIPPARHRSGRALKTLAQRLKSKEGRFRYNLSGKRVNYSARTVISVDPYIGIDEIGVPLAIAKTLTFPFYVTKWNIDKAKEMLKRTSYPEVLNVILKDGSRKHVSEQNREELLNSLEPGEILERQLVDGDIVLFNRQPSLHRISMMAHKVKITKGKTFRLNFCSTTPYNADFDGDEMNIHAPQTLEAQAEAMYLMDVKDQIFSPRDGSAIISDGEDGISGAFLLTDENTFLTKSEATYLLGLAGIYELPKEGKNGMYAGRDVFSMLLPKRLNFELKTKQGKIKIENGKIIEGTLAKGLYGRNSKLYAAIAVEFGNDVLRDFINKSSRMLYAYVTLHGLSIGIKDYKVPEEMLKERKELIATAYKNIGDLIKQYETGKLVPLVGYTRNKSLENFIIAELENVRTKAGEIFMKYTDPKNNALLISGRAGAKGSLLNIVQMSLLLGQQATLSGGRISRGYSTRRVLPHIPPKDITPSSRGFITSNFYIGLTPLDLYMHAIGSRSSVVYKALLTGRSGYLQRRLINALQDYYVEEDASVRDPHGNIIETAYGGNKIDPVYTQLAQLSD